MNTGDYKSIFDFSTKFASASFPPTSKYCDRCKSKSHADIYIFGMTLSLCKDHISEIRDVCHTAVNKGMGGRGMIDVEKATEEFRQRLESGYFDESDKSPLSGKEIDDLLRAVNTVQKHQSKIDLDDTGYDEGYQEAKTEFYENRYQEGLQDAWELASDIVANRGNIRDILEEPIDDLIFERYSATEALEKIKAYEQRIEVGDEIICKCPDEQKCVVVRVGDKEPLSITIMRKDGSCYSRPADGCTKTGKHYNIQSILDGLKED